MTKTSVRKLIVLCTAALTGLSAGLAAAEMPAKPNIVIIFTDDQG